jgi:hypothetical protein
LGEDDGRRTMDDERLMDGRLELRWGAGASTIGSGGWGIDGATDG